jgi:hypothetical protein
LLDFESTRLLVWFLGECFVDIGSHGSIRLGVKCRMGKMKTPDLLTVQFAFGEIGWQGGRLIAACRQFDMLS